MPPSKDGKLTSGEDLGKLLRKKQPNIKLMVLTMLNDVFRIKGIINDLKPEGFLIKTEITLEILSTAYYQVLNGNSYFSPEVGRLLKEPIDADIQIDSLDRKILYYISIGEKMKNLPMYIPLSMATIERRKKNLKSVLQLKSGSDRELLEKAREMGFI
jgi:DNA-binding NarL/FixJ family response regulator